MKVLFLTLLILLAGIALARPPLKIRPPAHPSNPNRYTGSSDVRAGLGRMSTVNYDATHVNGLISVDHDANVVSLQCVDATTLRVQFTTSSLPADWVVGSPLVGTHDWGCLDSNGLAKNIFAVIEAISASNDGTFVITIRPAKTQDVFTQVSLEVHHNLWDTPAQSVSTRATKGFFSDISHAVHNVWHGVTHVISDVEHGVKDVVHDAGEVIRTVADAVKDGGININKNIYDHVFGVNYNSGTHSAARPITLFSGAHGSVTCTDCYAYLDVTAHVNLHVDLTRFESEITLTGSGNIHIGADLNVHEALSEHFSTHLASLSYNIPLAIGFVPLDIAVTVGVDGLAAVSVDASVSTTVTGDLSGSITVGAAFGSRPTDYSQWVGHGDWYTLVTDSFKPTASISSHVSASGDVKLTLQTTLGLSIDGLGGPNFVLSPFVEPTITVNAQEQDRSLSGTADLRVYGGVGANLDVAFHLPLLGSKTFGPWQMFNKQWLLYQHLYPFSRTLSLPEQSAAARRLLQFSLPHFDPSLSTTVISDIEVPKQTTCNTQCTHVSDLSLCSNLNGAYVCVPQDQIAAREQAVADELSALLMSGPVCAQSMLPLLCELHLPRCDPSDKQSLLPLCYDSCTNALGTCGVSHGNITRHCRSLADSTASPLAGEGQSCVHRDTDLVAPRDLHTGFGECVSTQGLSSCSSSTGYVFVNDVYLQQAPDESAHDVALGLDAMIATVAAQYPTAKARAAHMLYECQTYLPACVPSSTTPGPTTATVAAVTNDARGARTGSRVLSVLPMCQSACVASFMQSGLSVAAGVCSHADSTLIGNYVSMDDSNCEGAVSLATVFVPPAGTVMQLPMYGFGLLLAALSLCVLAAVGFALRSVVLSRRLSSVTSVRGSEQTVPLVSPVQA